jgi:hypothetical protein
MIAFSSMRLVRVLLALVVAFWITGAGCLFGCENMTSAMASANSETSASNLATVVSGDACASMQSHDCCAKHRGKTSAQRRTVTGAAQGIEIIGISPAMTDCPLAINATAALANPRTDQSKTIALTNSAINQNLEPLEHRGAFLHPLRLPNRGHTYLHCCVFLI